MIAAPIGNLGDITLRALSILREVGAVAAEDTRVARRLLSAHGARGKRVICARAHVENRAARAVVAAAMADGCAYLCDAGTPAISDPGARLAAAARAAGVAVRPVPGPSALTAALSAAGIWRGEGRFCFFGFAPRAAAARARFFRGLGEREETSVFFESPRTAANAAAHMAAAEEEMTAANDDDGNGGEALLRVAVCRELTKAHEQIEVGGAREIERRFAGGEIPARGEFVFAAAAENYRAKIAAPKSGAEICAILRAELPPRRAAALTAKIAGGRARDWYRGEAE